MTPQSARSMTWASLALLLIGGMLPSPPGAIALAILAACCALVPIIYGNKLTRIAAVLLLLASGSLAVALYPAAQKDMSAYREHARPAAAASAPAATGNVQHSN